MDLGAAFEPGGGIDPPLDENMPRNRAFGISGSIDPFFIAGGLTAGGGLASVYQVGNVL